MMLEEAIQTTDDEMTQYIVKLVTISTDKWHCVWKFIIILSLLYCLLTHYQMVATR